MFRCSVILWLIRLFPFITTRVNISRVITWSSLWPPLDWFSEGSVISLLWTCGSTGFCVGMLVFLQIIRENIFYGYYSKCLCPATEVTVREIYSHPEPEVPGEYFWKYCFQHSKNYSVNKFSWKITYYKVTYYKDMGQFYEVSFTTHLHCVRLWLRELAKEVV